jgi:hypothetical protein
MTKTNLFHVFSIVAATIHGKIVLVLFQTQAQRFGDLSLLPISRDDGARENL